MCGRFALGRDADELADDLQQQLFGQDDDLGQEQDEDAALEEEEQAQMEQEQDDDSERNAEEALAELEAGDGAPVASGSGGASEVRKEAPVKNAKGKGKANGGELKERRIDWSSEMVKSRFKKRYNVAPRCYSPIIRQATPTTYRIDSLQWGLIPNWTKEPPQGPQHTINATCERLFEGGGTWGALRDKKRCVIVANGFYEWQKKDSKTKLPHFVKPKEGKLMLMAGMWDRVDYKGAFDEVSTFTIITVPVSKQLRFLHTRMPAILDSPEEVAEWLSDKPWSPSIQKLVRTYEGELEYYQVTPDVGKVQNESAEFIEPLAKKKGTLSNLFAKQMTASPTKNPAPTSLPRADSQSPSKSKSPGGSTSSSLMSKSLSSGSNPSTSTSTDEKPKPKVKKEKRESSPLETKAKAMARSFSDVIELSSGDEDEEDKKDSKPTPAKKVKVEEKSGGKKGSSSSASQKAKAEIQKKVDKEGGKLDSFFKKR